MEKRRVRRGQTSPGEERGNEIRKVVIAHGSVEFCEATPIGLAELFNDWEGRGCNNSVPEEVTKTTSSGNRTA